MRFIIRSTKNGERLPLKEVEVKRKAAKERILELGLRYLEYEATLGSLDPMGRRIEETVRIIEDLGGERDV
jgi:hypothetical protein